MRVLLFKPPPPTENTLLQWTFNCWPSTLLRMSEVYCSRYYLRNKVFGVVLRWQLQHREGGKDGGTGYLFYKAANRHPRTKERKNPSSSNIPLAPKKKRSQENRTLEARGGGGGRFIVVRTTVELGHSGQVRRCLDFFHSPEFSPHLTPGGHL